MTHYAPATIATKKSRRPTTDLLEGEDGESEQESDEEAPMVKPVKLGGGPGKKGVGSNSGTRKGKGKTQGQTKGK